MELIIKFILYLFWELFEFMQGTRDENERRSCFWVIVILALVLLFGVVLWFVFR
jgi:hypothetical protein